jgi:hypothetical protein
VKLEESSPLTVASNRNGVEEKLADNGSFPTKSEEAAHTVIEEPVLDSGNNEHRSRDHSASPTETISNLMTSTNTANSICESWRCWSQIVPNTLNYNCLSCRPHSLGPDLGPFWTIVDEMLANDANAMRSIAGSFPHHTEHFFFRDDRLGMELLLNIPILMSSSNLGHLDRPNKPGQSAVSEKVWIMGKMVVHSIPYSSSLAVLRRGLLLHLRMILSDKCEKSDISWVDKLLATILCPYNLTNVISKLDGWCYKNTWTLFMSLILSCGHYLALQQSEKQTAVEIMERNLLIFANLLRKGGTNTSQKYYSCFMAMKTQESLQELMLAEQSQGITSRWDILVRSVVRRFTLDPLFQHLKYVDGRIWSQHCESSESETVMSTTTDTTPWETITDSTTPSSPHTPMSPARPRLPFLLDSTEYNWSQLSKRSLASSLGSSDSSGFRLFKRTKAKASVSSVTSQRTHQSSLPPLFDAASEFSYLSIQDGRENETNNEVAVEEQLTEKGIATEEQLTEKGVATEERPTVNFIDRSESPEWVY